MNPDSPPQAFPYLLEAVIGLAIGAWIAVGASYFAKRPMRLLQDMALGIIGYVGGAAGVPYIPWHRNTITYRVGNTVVSTTTRHFQYPLRVAFVLAVLLPALYEFYRLVLKRSSTST
jgi:hypothetical protein